MSIYLDVSYYWVSVGCICAALAGFWAFRRVKGLLR